MLVFICLFLYCVSCVCGALCGGQRTPVMWASLHEVSKESGVDPLEVSRDTYSKHDIRGSDCESMLALGMEGWAWVSTTRIVSL